eukprot:TRINITY_DN10186_c0_g1_i1.p2 TRINITY_DN10186_c0_g1~~TRINITY_DN10186_c0_g1_i1.p2  ORF type:complete len:151 (+),score=3.89 TRINITY_DN10186_c0_g1_i1:34-486(+)
MARVSGVVVLAMMLFSFSHQHGFAYRRSETPLGSRNSAQKGGKLNGKRSVLSANGTSSKRTQLSSFGPGGRQNGAGNTKPRVRTRGENHNTEDCPSDDFRCARNASWTDCTDGWKRQLCPCICEVAVDVPAESTRKIPRNSTGNKKSNSG